MNVYPLKHYSIPQEIHGLLDDQYKKIQAAAIDMTDNLVVQAITQAAKEEGVTDLYLIDKKFAADAIKEKLEREDPKPLTIEELRKMDGEPVYVSDLRRPQNSEYCIIRADEPFVDEFSCAEIAGCEFDWYQFNEYGERWIAYRHKPKEVE